MDTTGRLLTRALELAERRRFLLRGMRRGEASAAEADAELNRLTASLRMAAQSLVMAYQDEVRQSPWYKSSLVRQEAVLRGAQAPHQAALAAARQGRHIMRAINELADREEEQYGEVRRRPLLFLLTNPLVDMNRVAEDRQSILDRLRLLLYDLANAGLPMPDIVGKAWAVDRDEILLRDDGGVSVAHSAWIEHWHQRMSGMDFSLRRLSAALWDWFPIIDETATSPEIGKAEAESAALEQRTWDAAVERLPASLREFVIP